MIPMMLRKALGEQNHLNFLQIGRPCRLVWLILSKVIIFSQE